MGEIAYQNKDITAKLLAEGLIGKSLAVFGLPNLRIVNSLPTNLPAIESNELRLDELFELDDGSIAIIDYESAYVKANFVKYINYIARVLKRYLIKRQLEQLSEIRMIVIYTADVERAEAVYDLGGFILRMEQAFLIHEDTEQILKQLRDKIGAGILLEEEDLMRLMILPLTVKGAKAKQPLIETAVELAKKISDRSQSLHALAGILTFSDKVTDQNYKSRIKEEMHMTQIGQMLIDEGIEQGIERGIQAFIQDNLEEGVSETRILEKLVRRFALSQEKAEACLKRFGSVGIS